MEGLTRPVQKVNAAVLGLDIHKDLIAYCLFDREGNEEESGAVGGTRGELEGLLDRFTHLRWMHVPFEATGGIAWLFDLFVERVGRQRVHVAQPRRIRMGEYFDAAKPFGANGVSRSRINNRHKGRPRGSESAIGKR